MFGTFGCITNHIQLILAEEDASRQCIVPDECESITEFVGHARRVVGAQTMPRLVKTDLGEYSHYIGSNQAQMLYQRFPVQGRVCTTLCRVCTVQCAGIGVLHCTTHQPVALR